MTSGSEIIPINSTQKHDPAWRHCQMIKNGERTQLKCNYCRKIFSGGGIHRIKEHLACQKGNAASCPRVPPDVQRTMQQSLDGVVVKKKKKQKIAQDIRDFMPIGKPAHVSADQSEVDTGLQLLALPDGLESQLELPSKKEDGGAKCLDRKKKGRVKNSSPIPVISDVYPISKLEPIRKLDTGSTKVKDQVHMAIGHFLYDVGLPLDAVNSSYFQPMIDAIASFGSMLEAPTYHDIRGWILKNSVEEVRSMVEQYKCAWGRTGCSIMTDEWKTEMGKTFISFLVYCPEGTMFLKSVDASDLITSVGALYELLKQVVEEVDARNVLQIITKNTENYAAAGKRLMETFPTLFWTPCAAQCINLILDDISKLEFVATVLESSKSITKFIYNYSIVLNMMRTYTGGKELLHPMNSQSGTSFSALKCMVSLKDDLKAFVASQEWRNCPLSNNPDGMAIAELLISPAFWSACSTVVHLTEPLVQILRMVDSDSRPAMGYLYAGIYRAKEAIKKELRNKKDYMLYWNVIDLRWDRRLHGPLHVAGFFLNPRFFYSIRGDVHNEIMSAMLDCIERLVPDTKTQDKINKELSAYKNATGDFGRKMAIRARHTLLPVEWWSTYGGGCPNLTRLAIRVLSQTCSTTGCKRDLIPLEQVHSQKRNRLEHQRLSDLSFVQYNLRLQQRQQLKNKFFDPISIDTMDILEDWVAEVPHFEAIEDSGWMLLNQPTENNGCLESIGDDPEAVTRGFEDEEIYNRVRDEEDGEDGS